MTIKELTETRWSDVPLSSGRPSDRMTDKQWQERLKNLRKKMRPCTKAGSKLTGIYSKESGTWNEETQGTYHGMTNYQTYCTYINSVLREIRMGHTDYCYYTYHIEDLLQFEPELVTKYYPAYQYWEVRL